MKNFMNKVLKFFSPSQERKEKIYNSLLSGKRNRKKGRGFNFKAILVCSLAAYFILVTAALLLIFPICSGGTSLLQNDDTQQHQINNPTDNSRLSAAVKSSESADVIENSMNETDKSVYKPDVKLLSNTMKLESSNKPGLPLTVGLSKDSKDNFNIKAINISVDYGTFLKWDSKTGVTSPVGPSITIDTEETFYWTPLDGSDTSSDIKNITILISAVAEDTVIVRQYIYITQYERGCYSTTIGKPEYNDIESGN